DVPRDPEDVRRERPRGVVALEPPVEADERLLERVLGGRGVREELLEEGQDRGRVALVERAEGGLVGGSLPRAAARDGLLVRELAHGAHEANRAGAHRGAFSSSASFAFTFASSGSSLP